MIGLGKHLSTGSEYPDSPCGSGDHGNFVYKLSEVTCPECKKELIKAAKRTLKVLDTSSNQGRG